MNKLNLTIITVLFTAWKSLSSSEYEYAIIKLLKRRKGEDYISGGEAADIR